MKTNLPIHALALFVLFACLHAHAAEAESEVGFVSLFNEKDLTGWGYRTNQFDGKTQSDDGRFTATNGMLVVNPRQPRLVQSIWTTREFSNDFVLKLEFRASTNAD